MNNTQIERFEAILSGVTREGIGKLLEAVRKSDFYTAPASTRFHGSYEGGLLDHSLNVYDCLMAKKESPIWKKVFADKNYTDETLAISALLHDLCKTYFYVKDFKNQKTYDPDKVAAAEGWQRKHDNNGDFIWETVPTYKIEDKFPYGHGEKSVMMIEQFLTLLPCERYAIRWHMGAYDCSPSQINSIGSAIELYPLVLALQEADQEASHLLEAD